MNIERGPDIDQRQNLAAEADQLQHDQAVLVAGMHAIGATARLIESADTHDRGVLVGELSEQLKEYGIEITDTQNQLSREEQRELFIARREARLRGRKQKTGPRIPYGHAG
jgi:hypothetical protein